MAQEKDFIVDFAIGALVSIETEATTVDELTEEEKEELIRKAVMIIETPSYENFVEIIDY